jgi:hypothetical protein
LKLPQRDLERLQDFALRELPKLASNAGVIDCVLTALDAASRRHVAQSP